MSSTLQLAESTMITASVSDTASTSIGTRSAISSQHAEKGKEKAQGCSNIWKEFTKEHKENGDVKIKCNHCKISYKFVGGSTTNLWAHFDKFHKSQQAGAIESYILKVWFYNYNLLYFIVIIFLINLLYCSIIILFYIK